MQVVCLLASNHNKFSFVFDCCFAPFDICRLPWPWDTSLLERRQYRENLGNSPSWRCKLPVSSFVSLPSSLLQAFILSPVFAGVLPTVLLSFLCHLTSQKFYKTCHHLPNYVNDKKHNNQHQQQEQQPQTQTLLCDGMQCIYHGWKQGQLK